MGFEQIKVELLDWWPKKDRDGHDGDKDVGLAAWASSLDKARADDKGANDILRVVNQIVDNQHDTPKETVWFKFFLTFPIFCERQFDKYRMTVQQQDFQLDWFEAPFGRWGITQNELSGRYRTIPERPYKLPQDVIDIFNEMRESAADPMRYFGIQELGAWVASEYHNQLDQQHSKYTTFLSIFPAEQKKSGHPDNWKYKRVREVLRGLLGTAYLTDMRVVCNLNAFEHIINQRLEPVSQVESQVAAYRLLAAARDNKVADGAIERMMGKNGWDKWCAALEATHGYDFLNAAQAHD